MKKIVTLFAVYLAFYTSGYTQTQKEFGIHWKESKTISTGAYRFQVPAFQDVHFQYSFENGLAFVAQWPIENRIDERNFSLQQVSYSPISISELKDVDLNLIPNEVKLTLKNAVGRDKKNAFLSLTPIVKDGNGGYKKVTSFRVAYTAQSQANAFNRNYRRTISNSVLSSGEWYKFYVDTTGVFKLSKNFLENLGIRTNQINPRQIKIYGNGGKMIPYQNNSPYPIDPEENAIKVVGEEDGVFDNEDYILFYAQGPNGYDDEKRTNINCYNTKTYYYLTVGPDNGKRISPAVEPDSTPDAEITTFQEYQYHETDEFNIAQVGRRWFGDRFSVDNEKSIPFQFPDLVTAQAVQLNVYVAAVSESASSMQVSVNGSPQTTLNLLPANEPNLATEAVYIGNVNVSSDNVTVALTYNNNGNPSALAYIDYVSIRATRNLNFSGKQFTFSNNLVNAQPGTAQYTLSNAANVQEIWDVTDIYNVQSYANTDSDALFSFKATMGAPRQYVTVSSVDYYTPQTDADKRVANQNLKGTIFQNAQGQFQDVDYIIITPQIFISQAERLAQINTDTYGLHVKVVPLDLIYNEFGVGVQDIGAIRNFVRYVYHNASTPQNRLKYLCLFGDASFDYKDRLRNNTNFVPSWHSYNSFNLTNAFVSDDFYGMMDEGEGTMIPSDQLDIAVGRMLIDSPQRAKEMVDKVALYHKPDSFGNWRNSFVVVSDDVDEDWERILQKTTDSIANEVTAHKPFMNATKIHSDAYQQQSAAGGDRYPQVTEALVSAIEKGALVINYFGHGGEDGLAHERFYLKPNILDLRNTCKFNCFVTVTCEFTKFDNPLRETAGELTYWNTQGGAISLITTTRQIFVSVGTTFNTILGEYLFSYSENDTFQDHEYPSMAEALRLTKNNPALSSNAQKPLVFYIGDPALKLAFAQPNIRLTHINDTAIDQTTEVLSALSKVKLAGEITDVNGNLLNTYNGTLSTIIFDKNIARQTLANDGTTYNGQVIRLDFETLGASIFRGQSSITNGQFEFEFIVPRDITIPVGTGKVSFYATNTEQTLDITGANVDQVQIGGINENAPEDNQGPEIMLYMNDENFVSGGITNESPSLLVKLQDENGINTASGIGHDIVAILDGDESNPYVMNDYYQTEVDDYQRGVVTYPLRDLEPGLHTLTVKAWDVYNNSSTAEIQFVVFDEDRKLVIENVLNYPNPFVNYTEFWFNHNSSAPLDVSVQIFTVSGKLVKTLNSQTNAGGCCDQGSSSLSRDIVWDGRDDFGDKIGKGVYIYKLTVFSSALNKKVEKIEKLVIL
ncbi:MAG TPA: type IX secretion system sortase PorU [Flavobacteriaceae bacterium]|nr:type IX secretion system sortase PorU [Flavobacteriaceae bacterium]